MIKNFRNKFFRCAGILRKRNKPDAGKFLLGGGDLLKEISATKAPKVQNTLLYVFVRENFTLEVFFIRLGNINKKD